MIRSIIDPLSDEDVVVDAATLIRHTGTPTGMDNAFKLVITEPTVDAFDGAQINFEFSGIPDGAVVTVDAWATTKDNFDDEDIGVDAEAFTATKEKNDQVFINQPGQPEATLTGEDNTAVVLLSDMDVIFEGGFDPDPDVDEDELDRTGGSLSTGRDVVVLRGWINFEDDDARDDLLPLNLDIQATADLGTIGVAKPKGADAKYTVPRFDSDKTTALTVIDSTSDQTKFLVPYAVTDGTSGGYDTGFSIANTTSGKTAQFGVVTFSFPGDATLEDFESGMVGPGENLTVLLSEILGTGAVYTGQVMITTEFNGAEGVAFVSNFLTFTSASPLIKEEKK